MHIVRPSRGTCNKLVKAAASTQGIRKLGVRDEKNYWSLTLLQLITFSKYEKSPMNVPL